MFPMFPLYPLVPNILKLGISQDEPPTIYSLLNSYVNFANDTPAKIKDLANAGRAMFFDFDYPLATGMTKSEFECMILNHFMMRRIGYETVTAFKIALNVKLNEIMPMYNKLFESINGWNIFTDGEIMDRTVTDSRTVNNTGTTSGTNNTTNSTTNSATSSTTSDRRFSDTPQNALQDVRDGQYVTEYNYDSDGGTSNSTSNTTSNSTSSATNNNSSVEGGNQTERIIRTPTDKMHLYTEFLRNRQNIYTMIFKDLDSLFYQIV